MRRVRFGLALGALAALIGIGACALDESGTFVDSGITPDVFQPDASLDMNAAEDVTYDVPDLGTGETESGLPCTCVVPPDAGNYVYVEYTPTSRPNCDTPAYANHVDWQEVIAWTPDTCSCTCSAPNPSPTCTCGAQPTFAISSGNGNCTDVTNENLQAALGPPGCDKSQQMLNPGSGKVNNMLAALGNTTCATTGGGCGNPNKVMTSGGPPTVGMGRACPLQAATSTCNGGNVCVPTQGAPYKLCVTNMTNDPCPSDFPVQHLVGTVQDSRGCGPNACGPGSCTLTDSGTCGVPQLILSPGDNNCGGTTVTLPVDNKTCVTTTFGDSVNISSTHYTIAQSGGACGLTSGFNPTGGVVTTGGYAICCQP